MILLRRLLRRKPRMAWRVYGVVRDAENRIIYRYMAREFERLSEAERWRDDWHRANRWATEDCWPDTVIEPL